MQQQESITKHCVDLCIRKYLLAADPAVIAFDTFKSIRKSIVFYQPSGRRHENAALSVFTQIENLAKFLPDVMLTVIFASGADVNCVNNCGRATCYNSVFITDNLLCFDECHGTTP